VDDSKTLSRSHSAVVEKKRELDDQTSNPAQRCQSETQSPRSREAKNRRMRTLNLNLKVGKMGFAKIIRNPGALVLLLRSSNSWILDTEELQQVSKP